MFIFQATLDFSPGRIQGLIPVVRNSIIRAGRFALSAQADIQRQKLTTEVCWGDLKSTEIIIKPLISGGESLPVIAEEEGLHRKPVISKSGPVVIFDPIDGTINYAGGGIYFGIAGTVAWFDALRKQLSPVYSIFYAPRIAANFGHPEEPGTIFEADSLKNQAFINGAVFHDRSALPPGKMTALFYRAKRVPADDFAHNLLEEKLRNSPAFEVAGFVRGASAILSALQTLASPEGPAINVRSASKIWDVLSSHHFIELANGAARNHLHEPVLPINWETLVEKNEEDDKGLFLPFPTVCGRARAVERIFQN